MSNSPDSFKVEGISIRSDRLEDGFEFNITNITLEVNVYESIFSAYLTGNILIFDDQELFRKLNMLGTERVKFSFRSLVSDEIITKNFVITNVESVKGNDNTSLLFCTMIEDFGYFSEVLTFNKAYKNTGDKIIEDILEDKLSIQLDNRPRSDVAQPPFRYVVPQTTPLEAIGTILSRITTDRGFPYFLYASLCNDRLTLTDLETIIESVPFNTETPFKFSQGYTQSAKQDIVDQLFSVDTFESSINEDTLLVAKGGGVGVKYNHLDINTGNEDTYHIDILAMIDAFVEQSSVGDDRRYNVKLVDEFFTPNPNETVGRGEKLTQYDTVALSHINVQNFDDAYGFNEFTPFTEMLGVFRNGIIQHFDKNLYKISGPGSAFTTGDTRTSVGHNIDIVVLKDGDDFQEGGSNVDEKRSGRFIMTAKRHYFDVAQELHRYSLECARLTNLEALD